MKGYLKTHRLHSSSIAPAQVLSVPAPSMECWHQHGDMQEWEDGNTFPFLHRPLPWNLTQKWHSPLLSFVSFLVCNVSGRCSDGVRYDADLQKTIFCLSSFQWCQRGKQPISFVIRQPGAMLMEKQRVAENCIANSVLSYLEDSWQTLQSAFWTVSLKR